MSGSYHCERCNGTGEIPDPVAVEKNREGFVTTGDTYVDMEILLKDVEPISCPSCNGTGEIKD